MVRAIGNQIYEVIDVRPGEPPAAGTTQQPLTRAAAAAMQIADLAEPVTANRNLQALALEQVEYPKRAAVWSLVGLRGALAKSSTSRSVWRRWQARLDGAAGNVDVSACSSAGTASSSSAPRRAARAT